VQLVFKEKDGEKNDRPETTGLKGITAFSASTFKQIKNTN